MNIPGKLTLYCLLLLLAGFSLPATAAERAVVASSFANMSTAKMSLGTRGGTIRIDSRQKVNDLTLPANIRLNILDQGSIVVASGKKLNIAGPLKASARKIFEGDVRLGKRSTKRILPAWWGAGGDGVLNDTRALQCALDAGENSGVPVLLLDKTYLVDHLLVSTSLTGRGTIKMNPKNTFVYHCVMFNGNNITINGIKIDGSGVTGGAYFYRGDRNSLINCTIKNTKRFGICDDGRSGSKIIGNTVSNVVRDGFFADGIYTISTTNCQIRNNVIKDVNGRIGIVSEGAIDGKKTREIAISGNSVTGCRNSSGTEYNAGIWVENTISAEVVDNEVKDCNEIGIMVGVVNQTGESGKITVKRNTISSSDIGVVVSEINCILDIDVTDNVIDKVKTGLLFCGARDFNLVRNSISTISNNGNLSGAMKRLARRSDAVVYLDSGFKGYPYSTRNVKIAYLEKGTTVAGKFFVDLLSTQTQGKRQGILQIEGLGSPGAPWSVAAKCNTSMWDSVVIRSSYIQYNENPDRCRFSDKVTEI